MEVSERCVYTQAPVLSSSWLCPRDDEAPKASPAFGQQANQFIEEVQLLFLLSGVTRASRTNAWHHPTFFHISENSIFSPLRQKS